MNKAYKYRIYPNKTQEIQLAKTFGSCRFYWNNLVASFNSYDKENNPNPVFKTQKELKQEFNWLSDVSASSLQQKAIDFKEFQKQLFSKSRKKKIGFPRFKKKSEKQSFRLPNQKFSLQGNRIRLEKIGYVRVVIDRFIPDESKLLSVTVSKNCSNQYFVSICFETIKRIKPKTNKTIGIDVGLKEFAVLSNGVVIKNPRLLREKQSELKRVQRHFSRKEKGSVRWEKNRLRVAKLHNKISNQRTYFLNNLTTKLVSEYDIICIEDLNISGMLKNHKLAKSISDVSWGEFRRMLEYKCEWYGKHLEIINRFEPSSKTCSCCGAIKSDLTLKDRLYECSECGLVIDRDLNASKNIKALGVNNAIRTQSDSKTSLEANCVEVFKN